MENLSKLTKEDLIKVIATMHNSIQTWDSGWGIPEKEAETLMKIGDECVSYCVKTDFNLPELK
jgi:DNA-binding transcriptional regulator YiaG